MAVKNITFITYKCLDYMSKISMENKSNLRLNSWRPRALSTFNHSRDLSVNSNKAFRNWIPSLALSTKSGRDISTSNSIRNEFLAFNNTPRVSSEGNMLKVSFTEANTPQITLQDHIYPLIWLRDNCQCPTCFHPVSLSRTIELEGLQHRSLVKHIKTLEGDQSIELVWNDGHKSVFASGWLFERAFTSKQRNKRNNVYKLPQTLWGSKLMTDLPNATYDDLMNNDSCLLRMLRRLEEYGFVVIEDAPQHTGVVARVADKVAFTRRTHYGNSFLVKVKSDPSNVAYSSGTLQLHVDLPYYVYMPGTQLVHCIVQYDGKGGDSIITDATNAAHQLKKAHRHLYDLLCSTLVDWCDVGVEDGKEFFKVLQQPIICLDDNGDVSRINFSQPQRDSFFNTTTTNAILWYEALLAFHQLLYHPINMLQFKMKPGTILWLDNHRVLHGRTSYESGLKERVVEGCYVDWDEVRSRRRVLEGKLDDK